MNNKQNHFINNIIRKRIKPKDRTREEKLSLARSVAKEIERDGILYCAEVKNKIDEALNKEI